MNFEKTFIAQEARRLGVPIPDISAQKHCMELHKLLVNKIADNGGRLNFAQYMEIVLYTPGLGYYSSGAAKFGVKGDFVTAPEISPLFSKCLANQVSQILCDMSGGDVLEVGAGSGIMAVDMLEHLSINGCPIGNYYILERSADLRARQYDLLAQRLPNLIGKVAWLDTLPDVGFRGVVVANELLDALPVHCFRVEQSHCAELYVSNVNGALTWHVDLPSSPEVEEIFIKLMRSEKLSDGYTSEIGISASAWIASIADSLSEGVILIIDYGFPRHEYYHEQRSAGTLLCHYRHRSHADPLVLVGLQDITAHVEFTSLAEAAVNAGLRVAGYTNQASFLLSNGITNFFEQADTLERLKWAQQVKKLTMPHEMGELFKVLALARKFDKSLQGFEMNDMRARL